MKADLPADQKKILNHLARTSSMGNVMEILQWPSEKFDDGFLLANDMQNRDVVKLLYSNFQKNQIVVELTLVGLQIGKE